MKNTLIIALMGLGGMGVGYGVGSASAEPETVTVTETETVEVEVPAEPEVITETVEVEVEVTPWACLSALDSADNYMEESADAFDLAAQGIEAAFLWDEAGLNAISAELDPKMNSMLIAHADYINFARDCRGE